MAYLAFKAPSLREDKSCTALQGCYFLLMQLGNMATTETCKQGLCLFEFVGIAILAIRARNNLPKNMDFLYYTIGTCLCT